MEMLRPYIDFASALLTPLIAILVALIAYRQYRIQEYRVRLDLYDKRLKIYEAVMTFFRHLYQNGSASTEELLSLTGDTAEARFLFKGHMRNQIDLIYRTALDLQEINRELSNHSLPVGPERSELAKKMTAHFKLLRAQRDQTVKLFEKYLRLDR
jgi:hypothetical protein